MKFDFLGLRTLTIIDWAVKAINVRRAAAGEPALDITALPLDDKPTYELFARGDTVAVFQFESRGMRELLKRAKPDTFEDIIALAALFRPGPLGSGMDKDWVDRKHGNAAVSYPHPSLEPVLAPTYGVIVYQEQVMQIAQVLAGYSLGGADLLRRAMGKKKAEEMAKERAKFEDGCAQRGIPARGRQPDLRPDGEVRRVRLQQVALGRVCAGRLPDRVAEGALPGRVHGRGAVVGHGQHRQGGRLPRRGARDGPDRAAAGRGRLGVHVRGDRAGARSATASAR